MPINAWQMGIFSVKHVMVKTVLKFRTTVLAQSPHLIDKETKAQRS